MAWSDRETLSRRVNQRQKFDKIRGPNISEMYRMMLGAPAPYGVGNALIKQCSVRVDDGPVNVE